MQFIYSVHVHTHNEDASEGEILDFLREEFASISKIIIDNQKDVKPDEARSRIRQAYWFRALVNFCRKHHHTDTWAMTETQVTLTQLFMLCNGWSYSKLNKLPEPISMLYQVLQANGVTYDTLKDYQQWQQEISFYHIFYGLTRDSHLLEELTKGENFYLEKMSTLKNQGLCRTENAENDLLHFIKTIANIMAHHGDLQHEVTIFNFHYQLETTNIPRSNYIALGGNIGETILEAFTDHDNLLNNNKLLTPEDCTRLIHQNETIQERCARTLFQYLPFFKERNQEALQSISDELGIGSLLDPFMIFRHCMKMRDGQARWLLSELSKHASNRDTYLKESTNKAFEKIPKDILDHECRKIAEDEDRKYFKDKGFIDPVSLTIFKKPVRIINQPGVFELKTVEWIKGQSRINPITNMPIVAFKTIAADDIKNQIRQRLEVVKNKYLAKKPLILLGKSEYLEPEDVHALVVQNTRKKFGAREIYDHLPLTSPNACAAILCDQTEFYLALCDSASRFMQLIKATGYTLPGFEDEDTRLSIPWVDQFYYRCVFEISDSVYANHRIEEKFSEHLMSHPCTLSHFQKRIRENGINPMFFRENSKLSTQLFLSMSVQASFKTSLNTWVFDNLEQVIQNCESHDDVFNKIALFMKSDKIKLYTIILQILLANIRALPNSYHSKSYLALLTLVKARIVDQQSNKTFQENWQQILLEDEVYFNLKEATQHKLIANINPSKLSDKISADVLSNLIFHLDKCAADKQIELIIAILTIHPDLATPVFSLDIRDLLLSANQSQSQRLSNFIDVEAMILNAGDITARNLGQNIIALRNSDKLIEIFSKKQLVQIIFSDYPGSNNALDFARLPRGLFEDLFKNCRNASTFLNIFHILVIDNFYSCEKLSKIIFENSEKFLDDLDKCSFEEYYRSSANADILLEIALNNQNKWLFAALCKLYSKAELQSNNVYCPAQLCTLMFKYEFNSHTVDVASQILSSWDIYSLNDYEHVLRECLSVVKPVSHPEFINTLIDKINHDYHKQNNFPINELFARFILQFLPDCELYNCIINSSLKMLQDDSLRHKAINYCLESIDDDVVSASCETFFQLLNQAEDGAHFLLEYIAHDAFLKIAKNDYFKPLVLYPAIHAHIESLGNTPLSKLLEDSPSELCIKRLLSYVDVIQDAPEHLATLILSKNGICHEAYFIFLRKHSEKTYLALSNKDYLLDEKEKIYEAIKDHDMANLVYLMSTTSTNLWLALHHLKHQLTPLEYAAKHHNIAAINLLKLYEFAVRASTNLMQVCLENNCEESTIQTLCEVLIRFNLPIRIPESLPETAPQSLHHMFAEYQAEQAGVNIALPDAIENCLPTHRTNLNEDELATQLASVTLSPVQQRALVNVLVNANGFDRLKQSEPLQRTLFKFIPYIYDRDQASMLVSSLDLSFDYQTLHSLQPLPFGSFTDLFYELLPSNPLFRAAIYAKESFAFHDEAMHIAFCFYQFNHADSKAKDLLYLLRCYFWYAVDHPKTVQEMISNLIESNKYHPYRGLTRKLKNIFKQPVQDNLFDHLLDALLEAVLSEKSPEEFQELQPIYKESIIADIGFDNIEEYVRLKRDMQYDISSYQLAKQVVSLFNLPNVTPERVGLSPSQLINFWKFKITYNSDLHQAMDFARRFEKSNGSIQAAQTIAKDLLKLGFFSSKKSLAIPQGDVEFELDASGMPCAIITPEPEEGVAMMQIAR